MSTYDVRLYGKLGVRYVKCIVWDFRGVSKGFSCKEFCVIGPILKFSISIITPRPIDFNILMSI